MRRTRPHESELKRHSSRYPQLTSLTMALLRGLDARRSLAAGALPALGRERATEDKPRSTARPRRSPAAWSSRTYGPRPAGKQVVGLKPGVSLQMSAPSTAWTRLHLQHRLSMALRNLASAITYPSGSRHRPHQRRRLALHGGADRPPPAGRPRHGRSIVPLNESQGWRDALRRGAKSLHHLPPGRPRRVTQTYDNPELYEWLLGKEESQKYDRSEKYDVRSAKY